MSEVYFYKLIEFVDEKEVKPDIVPHTWISYDSTKNALVAQFMGPPYTTSRSKDLHRRVADRAEPDSDWPKYAIFIKGEARTYSDALAKLKILESQQYAFSTENEEHAEARAQETEKIYKKKKRPTEALEINKMFCAIPSLMENEKNGLLNVTDLNFSLASKTMNNNQSKPSTSHEACNINNIDILDSYQLPIHQTFDEVNGNLSINMNRALLDEHFEVETLQSIIEKSLQPLSSKVSQLNGLMTDIKIQIDELRHIMVTNRVDYQTNSLPGQSNSVRQELDLPFKTIDDFLNFESRLGEDPAFRQQIFVILWPYTNSKKTIHENIATILKLFIAPAVMAGYTSIKKIAGKKVFVDTRFCACIREAISKEFAKDNDVSTLKDAEFLEGLKRAVNNHKDVTRHRAATKKDDPSGVLVRDIEDTQ